MWNNIVTSVLLGCCLSSAAAWCADWPQWRGPHRNGISPESDWSYTWLEQGPPQLWKANVGRGLLCAAGKLICLSFDGELSVVDADANVYRQLASCRLFHMDPQRFKIATGIEAGNVISPDVCRTPPALCGGLLYCRNAAGELVCLDLRKSPTKP